MSSNGTAIVLAAAAILCCCVMASAAVFLAMKGGGGGSPTQAPTPPKTAVSTPDLSKTTKTPTKTTVPTVPKKPAAAQRPVAGSQWFDASEPLFKDGKWVCEYWTSDSKYHIVDATADGCIPVGKKCISRSSGYTLPTDTKTGKCPGGMYPPSSVDTTGVDFQTPNKQGRCVVVKEDPKAWYGKASFVDAVPIFNKERAMDNLPQKLACPVRDGKCLNEFGEYTFDKLMETCPSRGSLYMKGGAGRLRVYWDKKSMDAKKSTASQDIAGLVI